MSSKEKLLFTISESDLTDEEADVLYQMMQVFIRRKKNVVTEKTEAQLAFEELERYRKSFPKTCRIPAVTPERFLEIIKGQSYCQLPTV